MSTEPTKICCLVSEVWLKSLASFKIIIFFSGFFVYIVLVEEAAKTPVEPKDVWPGYLVLTILMLILSLFNLIFNVYLWLGVFAEKPIVQFVQRWTRWSFLEILLSIVVLFISITYEFYYIFPLQILFIIALDIFCFKVARLYVLEKTPANAGGNSNKSGSRSNNNSTSNASSSSRNPGSSSGKGRLIQQV